LEVKSDWNWSTKLGIDGSEDGSTRGAYVAMRMMMKKESEGSYVTPLILDSQYLGDFYSDSGKPPLVVVAVVAAVSRL
jgi:hypothetical protein